MGKALRVKGLGLHQGQVMTLGLALILTCAQARAEKPAVHRMDAGVGLGAMRAIHVSGGTGSFVARSQGFALGAQLYGEWRLSPFVGVGLGVPVTINTPGATSNADDVGVTPRLRVGYPARDWLYPFILAEAGPAWSRQHSDAWLLGVHASVRAGARVMLSGAVSTFAEITYDYTSFSGSFPLYHATNGPPAPMQRGHVATSYGGIGVGLEVTF